MLKYSHPWLATLLHYWPAAILLPTILLLITALAVITHYWDEKDEAARRAQAPAPGRQVTPAR